MSTERRSKERGSDGKWWDISVNPVVGCLRCSEGCENCYAERMARRLKGMGLPQYQAVVDENGWTGRIGVNLNAMKVPGKSKRVFAGSMCDLAYDGISRADFHRVLGAIMLQPWHTFQFLTKRPAAMAKRIDRVIKEGTKERYLDPLMLLADAAAVDFTESDYAKANEWYKMNIDQSDRGRCDLPVRWPLCNLWLGATCEDQSRYDERSQAIVEARATLHFLSLEPLLGPIRTSWPKSKTLVGEHWSNRESVGIDWVIVGCESGPGRRTCKTECVADIVNQCRAANVPPFVKQIDIDGEVVHDVERIALELSDYCGEPLCAEDIRQYPKGAKP